MTRLVALLVLLIGSPALFGQTSAPARQEPPIPPVSETVEVSITNIEVVVTDSKGNRVSGLNREDFEVRQDGVPQTVTNFYAVAGGRVTLEDGKTLSLEEPEAEKEIPTPLKARYIVYIDNLNIQPQNRNRMFRSLKEFLREAVGPNAEAMVVTFNRSLKVKLRFTADPDDVIGAIEQTELETGGGTTLAGERRDAVARIDQARSEAEALSVARSYARSLRNDLEFAVDAIKNTLNGLAGVEGRKIFLYVSEGLPATAGLELYDAVSKKFEMGSATLEQFEYDMNSRYVGIVQAANAQSVTMYTLDASGLSTGELISAETRSTEVRPSEFFMRQNTQGPLQMMARETGGIAAVNTNDWKRSLSEVASDFSNFYSIGYRSAKSAVDRPHRIEVKVKRKGMSVRSRTGYLEKTVETRTAEAVVASLHYPREENPLGVSVTTGESKPYDKENFLLPVRVAVPIGRLALVPSGDKYEGSFFVYFAVLDVSGKQSDLQIQRQAISIPVAEFERAQRKDWYFDVRLIVVPGGQKLALAVRDGVSNQTSFLQKNLFVSVLPKEAKKGS